MLMPDITSLCELHGYLHVAMQLEHATIPPYLTALYSIYPDPVINVYPRNHLLTIVREEMLHLTLAANILNAVGGKPDLTAPDFIPSFPTFLPDGEKDFEVSLRPFSRAALETFLKIERPRPPEERQSKERLLQRPACKIELNIKPQGSSMHYATIGEFYVAIEEGLKFLENDIGAANLFPSGREHLQVDPQFYWGGGKCSVVTNLDSALKAIDLIKDQGEGFDAGVCDSGDLANGELAHYYRFDGIYLGQEYRCGDTRGKPSGRPIAMDWDKVYPIKINPTLGDYMDDPELYQLALDFNITYANLLKVLTDCYNGHPKLLAETTGGMMQDIRNRMIALFNIPIKGMECVHAGPTFEMPCK
jgi:hypothetical protein